MALKRNSMKKSILVFAAGAMAMVCLGLATTTVYRGSFSGNGAGLTNLPAGALNPGTYQPASANLTNWSSLATTAVQPATANLTNWSALATGTRQPASLALTNLAAGNGAGLTNTPGPIVASTTGITVAPSTNASTGQITYTLSVP